MIIRLGRLTPGYFRLLQVLVEALLSQHHTKTWESQRQISGEVRMQQQSNFINPIALTMATVGMGVSLYSTRRMSERVHLKRPDA